jgi:hypothetical protein
MGNRLNTIGDREISQCTCATVANLQRHVNRRDELPLATREKLARLNKSTGHKRDSVQVQTKSGNGAPACERRTRYKKVVAERISNLVSVPPASSRRGLGPVPCPRLGEFLAIRSSPDRFDAGELGRWHFATGPFF